MAYNWQLEKERGEASSLLLEPRPRVQPLDDGLASVLQGSFLHMSIRIGQAPSLISVCVALEEIHDCKIPPRHVVCNDLYMQGNSSCAFTLVVARHHPAHTCKASQSRPIRRIKAPGSQGGRRIVRKGENAREYHARRLFFFLFFLKKKEQEQ